MAEWLRRLTRNQIPSGSAGSNPAGCVYFYTILFSGTFLANSALLCALETLKYSLFFYRDCLFTFLRYIK